MAGRFCTLATGGKTVNGSCRAFTKARAQKSHFSCVPLVGARPDASPDPKPWPVCAETEACPLDLSAGRPLPQGTGLAEGHFCARHRCLTPEGGRLGGSQRSFPFICVSLALSCGEGQCCS